MQTFRTLRAIENQRLEYRLGASTYLMLSQLTNNMNRYESVAYSRWVLARTRVGALWKGTGRVVEHHD